MSFVGTVRRLIMTLAGILAGAWIGSGLSDPPALLASTVKVDMQAVETEVVVDGAGRTYHAWTFNNQFPGPVVRVQEGDTIEFTFTNPASNTRPHSMDFHAAETSFLENYREVNPGESLSYTWKARRPGVFVYHCGATPMIQHVARGMVGAIIVDPKDAAALPKADREYVLVQTELFKDPNDLQAMFDRRYENVVFNGGVFRYDPVHSAKGGNVLEAKPGERVRFYFINGGPNNVAALHLIAEIWEDVWESGNPSNRMRAMQTYLIPPAGAAILDLVPDQAGVYPIVTHALTDALRGAIALLKVDRKAKTLPLMPFLEPGRPNGPQAPPR